MVSGICLMNANAGKNIREIRKSLNLSVKRFSELTGISKATIVNIEQGHTGLKVATVKKLIAFTNFSFDEVDNEIFTVPKNLKKQLFENHKNNLALRQFFLVKPKIIVAINDELVGNNLFKKYREIQEIVYFFESLGWTILGTSLQNELKKHPKVTWINHPTKGNTYQYKLKD